MKQGIAASEKSLRQFRANPPVPVFVQATAYPSFFNRHLVHRSRRIKALLNDPNANIRVFYFQYLMLCYEIENQNYQYYISKLQNFVLDTSFAFLFLEDDDPTLYNDKQFKCLLLEFMEVLDSGEFETIESALNSFPIADTIFVYFFRSLAIYAELTNDFDTYIDKTVLFGFLLEQFSIDAQMFEDKCIKFIEAEVFVYEENERTVYLVYKDIDSTISDPTNSKMLHPQLVEIEHEDIDVNSMLDSKKEEADEVHQNISMLEQDEQPSQAHHSRSNSLQNPTPNYDRQGKDMGNQKEIEKEEEKGRKQQEQDARVSSSSNFKKNKIVDSEDIYRKITDDMMQKPSVLSCNDEVQPDSERDQDGNSIRKSVAEYTLELKEVPSPQQPSDYSKRLLENNYGLQRVQTTSKIVTPTPTVSQVTNQYSVLEQKKETEYSDYGLRPKAESYYHDDRKQETDKNSQSTQKETHGGVKTGQFQSLATTQEYSPEYTNRWSSHTEPKITNSYVPGKEVNYGDYMLDALLGRNKTSPNATPQPLISQDKSNIRETNSQTNTGPQTSSKWAGNHNEVIKSANNNISNAKSYHFEIENTEKSSSISDNKINRQPTRVSPTRDVPTHDVFTPTAATVSGKWPHLNNDQSGHTSPRESLGVVAPKGSNSNFRSAHFSNEQKLKADLDIQKNNKQPVFTLFDPTLKQMVSRASDSNINYLYDTAKGSSINLANPKKSSGQVYENATRDLRQESIKNAEDMKQFIASKLSVSKEFTDSLTLAKMGEPYSSNIKRMKVRSRETRQSLLNMIK